MKFIGTPRIHADEPVLMRCGHPRAARMIESVNGRLVTACWACKVEKAVKA